MTSLVKDIQQNMVCLTSIADSIVNKTHLHMEPFCDLHSTQHFASRIYPCNPLTGYTGTATTIDSENKLGAHVNRFNSARKECDQVVGSYRYNLRLSSDGNNKIERNYCGDRCMSICDGIAHDGANVERLYNDLPITHGIVTGVHILRTVF